MRLRALTENVLSSAPIPLYFLVRASSLFHGALSSTVIIPGFVRPSISFLSSESTKYIPLSLSFFFPSRLSIIILTSVSCFTCGLLYVSHFWRLCAALSLPASSSLVASTSVKCVIYCGHLSFLSTITFVFPFLC